MSRSIFPILSSVLLLACTTPIADVGSTAGHEYTEELATGPNVPGVSLDNGHRWMANPETTLGIMAMQTLITGYPSNGIAPELLKDTLEAEFALIFERCTMTGEAHEQLHNYLMPIHSMLRELQIEPTDVELAAIRSYLDTYGTYFE